MQSDLFLVKYFSDDRAVGIYSLAASLSFLLFSVPQSLAYALFPNVAKMELVDKTDATDKTLRFFRLTLIITLGISATAAFASEFFIGLVYGKEYLDAVSPFRLLCAALPIAGAGHVLESQIYSRNLIWRASLCSGLAALLNLGLNLYLVPHYSYMGAAFSSLVSYAFYGAVITSIYLITVKRSPRNLIPRPEDFGFIFTVIVEKLGISFKPWKAPSRAAGKKSDLNKRRGTSKRTQGKIGAPGSSGSRAE